VFARALDLSSEPVMVEATAASSSLMIRLTMVCSHPCNLYIIGIGYCGDSASLTALPWECTCSFGVDQMRRSAYTRTSLPCVSVTCLGLLADCMMLYSRSYGVPESSSFELGLC
jgi:hypothetical protein